MPTADTVLKKIERTDQQPASAVTLKPFDKSLYDSFPELERALVADPEKGEWFTAHVGDKPVGLVGTLPKGKSNFIQILIRPENRGHGLTGPVEDALAAHKKIDRLYATILPTNVASLKAHHKAGFKEISDAQRNVLLLLGKLSPLEIRMTKDYPEQSKAAGYAPGIAEKGNTGDPTQGLTPGQLVTYVLQHHKTQRRPNQPHYDLRLGTPDTGMFSWAVPKAQLPEPGEKRLAPQTEVHDFGYNDFQGHIGKGYGAGDVRTADKGKAVITKVSPNAINFTLAHTKVPVRYSLVKINTESGRDWLLIGKPVGKGAPGVGDKLIMQKIDASDTEAAMAKADDVQAKIDGASMVYNVEPQGNLETYSVRKSVKGQPIVRTEWMGLGGVKLPKSLAGTTFRGEGYAVNPEGKPLKFQQISGLLNAGLAKSLERQKAEGIKMKTAPFAIEQYKGKPVNMGSEEERAALEKLMQHLPTDHFELPERAVGPEAGKELLGRIEQGQHPQTEEGVVMRQGPKRVKYVIRPSVTGYLQGTFPGIGKREGTAGGLLASLEPTGPANIRLGTGFSDKELQDIIANMEEHKGKPIRIEHKGQFGTGLLRAPAYKGFETDKPVTEKSADRRLKTPRGYTTNFVNQAVAEQPWLVRHFAGEDVDKLNKFYVAADKYPELQKAMDEGAHAGVAQLVGQRKTPVDMFASVQTSLPSAARDDMVASLVKEKKYTDAVERAQQIQTGKVTPVITPTRVPPVIKVVSDILGKTTIKDPSPGFEETPAIPDMSFMDKFKGTVSRHPIAATSVALGVPALIAAVALRKRIRKLLNRSGVTKEAVIKPSGKGYVLYNHTGKKILGHHKSRASALRQERAIQAHKHAGQGLTSEPSAENAKEVLRSFAMRSLGKIPVLGNLLTTLNDYGITPNYSKNTGIGLEIRGKLPWYKNSTALPPPAVDPTIGLPPPATTRHGASSPPATPPVSLGMPGARGEAANVVGYSNPVQTSTTAVKPEKEIQTTTSISGPVTVLKKDKEPYSRGLQDQGSAHSITTLSKGGHYKQALTIGDTEISNDTLKEWGSIGGGIGVGSLLSILLNRHLNKQMEATRPITEAQRKKIMSESELTGKVHTYPYKDYENAAYIPPHGVKTMAKTDEQIADMLTSKQRMEKAKEHGIIVYDPKLSRIGVIGHEAGHAEIGNRPWYSLSRINQGLLRPLSMLIGEGIVAPTVGLTVGSKFGPLAGLAAGGGAGLLAGLPTLINEAQASRHSNEVAKALNVSDAVRQKHRKMLRTAWGTYLLGATAVPAAMGGIYGALQKYSSASVHKDIRDAAKKVDTNPTEAQKVVGNYRKGHVRIHGIDITIENPKGSIRSGKDKDGKAWSVKLNDHYGYIKQTESDADNQHIDVFIGPKPQSHMVFIIDQHKINNSGFDEHKVMLGYHTSEEAKQAYLSNYIKDWKGFADITALSLGEFRKWLKDGLTNKPAADQFAKWASVDDPVTAAQQTLAKLQAEKLRYAVGAGFAMRHLKPVKDLDVDVHPEDFDKAVKILNATVTPAPSGKGKMGTVDGKVPITLFDTPYPEGFGYSDTETYDTDEYGNKVDPMKRLIAWKKTMGRPKDFADLILIAKSMQPVAKTAAPTDAAKHIIEHWAKLKPWHGVDLDGCLATSNEWEGNEYIGRPIRAMVDRVKRWLEKGDHVKIFTARVTGGKDAIKPIQDWCREYFGKVLPVTNVKDPMLIDLWDDRAHRVVKNEGTKVAAWAQTMRKGL